MNKLFFISIWCTSPQIINICFVKIYDVLEGKLVFEQQTEMLLVATSLSQQTHTHTHLILHNSLCLLADLSYASHFPTASWPLILFQRYRHLIKSIFFLRSTCKTLYRALLNNRKYIQHFCCCWKEEKKNAVKLLYFFVR